MPAADPKPEDYAGLATVTALFGIMGLMTGEHRGGVAFLISAAWAAWRAYTASRAGKEEP